MSTIDYVTFEVNHSGNNKKTTPKERILVFKELDYILTGTKTFAREPEY